MRKVTHVLVCILGLTVFNSKAQIALEHFLDSTYTADLFYCTDVGNNDFKYVRLNPNSNSFSLYNMDMSPFMTDIPIPVTDSIKNGFTVIYITKSLFDCDSTNIEYAYDYYWDLNHPFRVFRTDGTLLLKVDSANGPNCNGCFGGSFTVRPIINTSAGAKLFLQKRNGNTGQLLIYALCGELPVSLFDFPEEKSFVKLYPNPSSGRIDFEIYPPNNIEQFELRVVDGVGKEQKLETATFQGNRYSIDAQGLSSGTYFYSLISKGKVHQSGKFILTK